MSVNSYSPSDLSRMSQMDRRARGKRIGGPKDILNRRFERSYLSLVNIGNECGESGLLDSVPVITELHISSSRHIWPATCSIIFSKPPQLRSLNANLWDNEKKYLNLRRRARNGRQSFPKPGSV
jgi:hypothetical protein